MFPPEIALCGENGGGGNRTRVTSHPESRAEQPLRLRADALLRITAAVIAPAVALSYGQGVVIRLLIVSAAAAAALMFITNAEGASWPTSAAARRWRPPAGWIAGALCIHRHESVDWHRRWVDWAGKPSRYAGGMQFLESTWLSVGGTGEPWQWSPREQLYRAFRVWSRDGRSWGEWGSAGRCGL